MQLSQLHRPIVATVAAASSRCATAIALRQVQDSLAALRIGGVEGRRYASVKSQGVYRKSNTDTIPKKMGAKKTGDTYVIPGNIIYKQRGTIWWPGENVGMGRDHTLFARETGFVKYYRDPARHPDRQYIGVVFNKDDVLPYPQHAARKRRLGMTASVMPEAMPAPEISESGIPNEVRRLGTGRKPHPRDERVYKLQKDGSYSYREENWRLGTLVRTEKRKLGSRRVAMRHRRKRSIALQQDMRRDLEVRKVTRQEHLKTIAAAKAKRTKEYAARQKADQLAEAAAKQAVVQGQTPGQATGSGGAVGNVPANATPNPTKV